MAYKAFVASTLEDLREHRKFVIHALRISGILLIHLKTGPRPVMNQHNFPLTV